MLHFFYLAETLGKTVDELLTGKPCPISDVELRYWPAYRVIKQELEDAANKKKSKKSGDEKDPAGTGFKKTMGQR